MQGNGPVTTVPARPGRQAWERAVFSELAEQQVPRTLTALTRRQPRCRDLEGRGFMKVPVTSIPASQTGIYWLQSSREARFRRHQQAGLNCTLGNFSQDGSSACALLHK